MAPVDPRVARDPKLVRELQGKHRMYHEARERRRQVLEAIKAGKSIEEALADIVHPLTGQPDPIAYETYRKWRTRWPEFRYEIDSARIPAEDQPTTAPVWKGKGGFASFRKQYFGMDSPWFHLEVVDALEHGEPGSITLILLPPEHGKTTLLEDYCNYKLAVEPTFRITYGSEGSDHAEKALGRVRKRMEADGGNKAYVRDFGPFEPDKENRRRQKWTDKKFDVRKKGSYDERDYSMVAIGITSRVAGTRTDLLVPDDIMSLRNLGQAEAVMEVLRQDWLSRPGAFGRTVIIGTRVGEGDVYELLMDAIRPDGSPLLDRVIKYPAVRTDVETGAKVYLWPERYSPRDYEKMEGNVGEEAWLRNYQQQPRGKQQVAFTAEIIGKAQNEALSWRDPPPQPDHEDVPQNLRLGFTEIWAGIDPALGGVHATSVSAISAQRFRLLDLHGKAGLAKTSDMLEILDSMLAVWDGRGLPITKVVVEDKHQRNLMNDEGMILLQAKYGFEVLPHQTQGEKNDEDIGVSAMAKSMLAGELEIPWAEDHETRLRFQPLVNELLRWRPRKRATRLKQDRIMAVWFPWLWWRRLRRSTLVKKDHEVKMSSLPFKPTNIPMHTGTIWTPESSRPPRRRSA